MVYFIIGLVMCVAIVCYTIYKQKELIFRQYDSEYARDSLKDRTALDIEQEKTKQHLLDRDREAERTKQLEIKANFKKEHNEDLY